MTRRVATTEDQQRHLMRMALERAGLTSDELWLRYFSLGGSAGPADVDQFLGGGAMLDAPDRDLLALAVNEHLDDATWKQRVPFLRTVRTPAPETGPFAALDDLLRGTHLHPPLALQDAVDRAGRSLRVRATVYLADREGAALVPLVGAEHGATLDIERSAAGRAYRRLATVVSTDGTARLWVPIIDGVERLGVLDVVPDDPAEVHDPTLRHECWSLAHYLGHVVEAIDRYGDGLEAVRRLRPRSTTSELMSRLLPPRTAGTGKVLVAGLVEPCDRMGGDVFDYALSEGAADLGIFDGMGHDLHAGVIAAVAVAAYRNARREGRGLFGQVQAVHDTLVGEFGPGSLATGVVARLDLDTGELRYVSAGHPSPVVLREGRRVRTLQQGRRALLGLDESSVVVGQEHLQPDDLLVLYTDGVTDARDADHRRFGLEGLTDLLAREHAATTPLPEVARRVARTVRGRTPGGLVDDATVLLAHWTTGAQVGLDPVP